MMENYDEIRCDNARHTQKTLDALNTATLLPQDMSDLLALNAEQQQNFNFGAEILTVQPQQQQQQEQQLNGSAAEQQQLHTLQAEEEEAAHANNSCFLSEQQHAGVREEEADAQLLLSTTVTERESEHSNNSYFLPEQQAQQQQQHGLALATAQLQTNIEIKTTTTTTAEGEFIVDKQIVGGGVGSTYAANPATDESSGNIDEEDDEVDDEEGEGEGEDSDEDEEADEDDDDDEEDESETDATKNATVNFQNKMNNIMHQNKQQNGQNGGHGVHSLGSSQEQTDETSSDSDFSDLSGMSDVSGREWKPISSRPMNWVQKQMHLGADPREILSQILPATASQIAPGISDMTLWRILASMLAEPPRRQKLRYINTFQDVVRLVRQAKNIIVLTGAGVSVSCGIPDFRSSDGIYSRLAKDYPDLPDPQAMFDINYFSRDPRPFYKFAREIYPGQFRPSPCHRFIKLLEQKQKLLRNYTQNIDTLEQVAGIRNKIECHGSFSTASCTKCKYKCDAEAIRADIFAQRIPVCPICQPNVHQSVDASNPVSPFELRRLVENGIMKPDIVFFGEGLPEEFHTVMASDKDKCDLLIVMGSSLKVRPVALIPSSIPPKVPQILINREQLHHLEFDVELLGDSDVIINQLCHCLGADWQEICYDQRVLTECQELLPIHSSPKPQHADEVIDELLLHDAETQSLKSESSADLVSITGTYSDSGFESSTSSKAQLTNSNLAGAAGDNLPPPELLEGPNDCHTFAERLAPPAAVASSVSLASSETAYNRHYSVDSTKDSGIGVHSCGESSNSSALTNHGSSLNIKTTVPTPTASPLGGDKPSSNQQLPKRLQPTTAVKSRPSAADRLPPGCYYAHESSAAYVFPGAQVNWSTDTEDESGEETVDDALLRLRRKAALAEAEAAAIEGDDEKEADSTCCEDAEDDESQTATTVVDEELMDTVSTMSTATAAQRSVGGTTTTTTTTVTKTCIKRHSSGGGYDEELSTTVTTTQVATSDEGIATSVGGSDDCSSCGSSTPPPLKKRRDGQPGSMTSHTQEPPAALQQQQQQHTSAIITTTTTTASSSSNNSFLSTSLEPPETLLQPQ